MSLNLSIKVMHIDAFNAEMNGEIEQYNNTPPMQVLRTVDDHG